MSERLDRLTRTGELYEKLENGVVRCYACAHRCLIKPGRRGICQVRFNQDGELRVPWGYVAALQIDPIEKKPFSHMLPGSDALTFGMLGCDLHCSYCFPGETMVVTNYGPIPIRQAFDSATIIRQEPDGEIVIPENLMAVTGDGRLREVKAVFRHPYRGELVTIAPHGFPVLKCTPDHKIYVTPDPDLPPEKRPAREITNRHYLVVPRNHSFEPSPEVLHAPVLSRASTSGEVREPAPAAGEKGAAARPVDLVLTPEYCVPQEIFNAPREEVSAFLSIFVAANGHVAEDGKVSISGVSRDLANGIAWLVLKLGFLPSLSGENDAALGRDVDLPQQYSVTWYENAGLERQAVVKEDYFLVQVRQVGREPFDGSVYNMEVDEVHNYLAGFHLVSNCQNWNISQYGRDEDASYASSIIQETSPEELVRFAQDSGAEVIVSSYNEPLITSEWAAGVFRQALKAGLKCAFVSNGNATPEVLAYLRPYLSAYKVDLKTMQDRQYRKLGAVLQNVLDTIKMAHDVGLWVEVVTLVVPGFNDDPAELWDAARFLVSVSPDIPWHVTAFHPDYKMDRPYTPAETLRTAAEIGQEAGLRYVYAGNLPGQVENYEDTICPGCNKLLVKRRGFGILEYHITGSGACAFCGVSIPGIWPEDARSVRLRRPGFPRGVRL